MTRIALALAALLALSACVVPAPDTPAGPPPDGPAGVRLPDPATAARNFATVVARVEPLAEAECRAAAAARDCDFLIAVDDRADQPANAFQTLDRNGRPVVVFTLALIADAANQDELAFVLGHEAGHHIAGHIARSQGSAMTGALIFGTLASLSGAPTEEVRRAQQVGATLGARRYSREFELEADALGTVIAYRAGYDPARGAAFFDRLPDPGDRFLGSHPPNAERRAVVLRTLAQIGARPGS
jgi:predicted Zn-dependent protease